MLIVNIPLKHSALVNIYNSSLLTRIPLYDFFLEDIFFSSVSLTQYLNLPLLI